MTSRHLISVLILSVLFGLSVSAQISPGELSKAHVSLDGVKNCTKCHSEGNKVSRNGCLSCHKEIKANIAARKGYHASPEVNGKECFVCHNEHHGRNFQIVKFKKETFNHQLTGFILKGAHAKQDCKKCHNASHISDPALKRKPNTFLGLKQECLSCHADYHQGKMSGNCAQCHNFDSFKNPVVKGFDHNTTHFPLLGQHKNVSCVKCHKTEIINGKAAQKFTGLVFNNCTGCHKDVHENKFGQNCKQCHSEESFHKIKGVSAFDHDKTQFKLIGKHQQVACKACHKGNMTDPIKHDHCNDCHTDYHKGEFAKNGASPDCSKCHTNSGFGESLYSIEQHSQTEFPLEGAHMATPCLACHKKQDRWTFSKMGSKCVDCHKNEHKGFIKDKYFANENCTVCHNVNSWKKVTFDHNQTGFRLEGKHSDANCSSCHYKKNKEGVRTQIFAGLSSDCMNCHRDHHKGQFAENGITDCKKCHGFDNWKNSKFDHNTSRFKLTGAHAKASCEKCHKEIVDDKGKFVQYKFKSIECSSCHS